MTTQTWTPFSITETQDRQENNRAEKEAENNKQP